ncbi:Uncharacterized protein SHERM_22968 [Striga hermonthica]|uniref:Uncharacterized protein n=1 Tax=Striga hermonthica TaxID=68872 RepID=A0A9N7REY7_STRHE|nr:Uncharacterized protein SHERM_22968 [Striga hermonthica]
MRRMMLSRIQGASKECLDILLDYSLARKTSSGRTDFFQCNEDQMTQLLSAVWIQVNLPDNLPANIEAIAHSFCLALISCRLKNSNDSLILRFFQLPFDSNHGPLPPAYRRSLVLSTAMVMFAAKLYHIAEIPDLLNLLLESDVDAYIGIRDDFQVYVKSHSEVKDFGSASDNEEALLTHVDLRGKAHRAAHSKGSQSFDGEFSANSLVEDDAMSISSFADITRFIPKVPASPSLSPSMSHIASIGQLLESATFRHLRKKLSNWLVQENTCPKANDDLWRTCSRVCFLGKLLASSEVVTFPALSTTSSEQFVIA